MSQVKVSDYVVRRIADLGVTHVFMVSGGGAMHLDDSLGKEPRITLVCDHHEQACAMAVEGYARVRGAIGVACVTTGPGGTNTLTGVLGQWHDSVPALYVSGQVRYDTTAASTHTAVRQLGDQEGPITDIVAPVTKYAVTVTDPKSIRYHFEKAVHLATHGRPGPVWLDIPLNVQAAMVEEETLAPYVPEREEGAFDRKKAEAQIDELMRRLRAAERPVVLAGSAVRIAGVYDEFLRVIDKIGVPVATTWKASDLLWEEHPLFAGRPGTVGDRAGNFAVQNADLLLVLGSRLNIRQVGYEFKAFARAAYRVVVDIDPLELAKPTIFPDMPIHADVGWVLDEIERRADADPLPRRDEWIAWCLERRRRYPVVLPEYRETTGAVQPYVFVDELAAQLREGDVVVTANGAASVVTFQALELKRGQRLLANSGTASMGYDLPAAIGAAFAHGDRIVCMAGDGSIQMNIQELQTLVHHALPVKVFLFDNVGYLSIRQTQDNLFGGHHVGEGPDSGVTLPDMVKVAEAYGIPARRIASHGEIAEAVEWALSRPGPALVDVVMPTTQPFSPKVVAERLPDGTIVSKPLEDMWPFLPRDEFASNMLVDPWESS